MTVGPSTDFDIDALFTALDAQRQARGLRWQQVAREINGQFGSTPARSISASTLTGLRKRGSVEGDGVLQMLRWLGRTAESFVPGAGAGATGGAWPDVPPQRILRFDARLLHAALDAERVRRHLTWREVARDIGGVNADGLRRLANGGRVAFPQVMRLVRWLGRPVAAFTRVCDA